MGHCTLLGQLLPGHEGMLPASGDLNRDPGKTHPAARGHRILMIGTKTAEISRVPWI
jgi:hypothetical protein